jgi:spoIIIJ-associated protein
MEELEISAKTVEDAILEAEEKFGLNRTDLTVEIINKGRQGLFKEKAVIRVKSIADPGKDIAQLSLETAERLLELLEVTGTVNISLDDTSITLDIEGDDLGILIGRNGRTLSCLQYLVRTVVSRQADSWIPLTVDVNGYRKRREERLQSMALSMARQVKLRRNVMTLEPMPADERRIIHLTLANHPDITTHSTGEGKNRKVSISLKRA